MTLDASIPQTTQQASAVQARRTALDRLRALLGPAFQTATVTTEYGVPAWGTGQPHTGIDLAAAEGTPIQEPIGGTVERVWTDSLGGHQVAIKTPQGYREVYAHLSAIPAFLATTSGAEVPAGAVVGYVGRTGLASGAHLHYEVAKPGGSIGTMFGTIDPLAFIGEFAGGGSAPKTYPLYGDPITDATNAKAKADAESKNAGLKNPLDALPQIASDFGRLVGDVTSPQTWARVGLTLAAVGLIGAGMLMYGRSFVRG